MSTHKADHGHDHRTDNNLLNLIAEKERELEARVGAARQEAAAIAAQARTEAERILSEARQQAVTLTREHEQRLEAETVKIQRDLVSQGAADVETLRRQAASRRAAAVQIVVDRVITGD
jgi:vacuolar-type H+-ATPase subunit H